MGNQQNDHQNCDSKQEYFAQGVNKDREDFAQVFEGQHKHKKRLDRSQQKNAKQKFWGFFSKRQSPASETEVGSAVAPTESVAEEAPEQVFDLSLEDSRTQDVADSESCAVENEHSNNSETEKAATQADQAMLDRMAAAETELTAGVEGLRQKLKNRLKLSETVAKKRKKYCLVAVGVLLAGVMAYYSYNGIDYMLHGKKAYAITVNNQKIAMVDDYGTANDVIKDYLAGNYTSTKLKDAHFLADVKIDKVYQPSDTILDYNQAQNKLAATAPAVADCVTIQADGVDVVHLAKTADADTALQMLKDAYVPEDSSLKVTDVKFKEQVQVVPDTAKVDEILSVNDAVKQMKSLNSQKSYVYTVEAGDTLDAICESEGVTADDLTKVSDDIDFENLKAGDQLKIDKKENLINVLTVMEKTKSEIIFYDISYQENDEMPAGTQNVIQEGFDGAENVDMKLVRINGEELYRERLSADTTIPATTKIVDCGTKVYRSDGTVAADGKVNITSASQMIWPTSATAISSPYGVRDSGFHTGLDINGETGDSVWAALSGTVVTAGWCGNYGNCIVIKHSDGLSTRYAHLSAISVGVGQSVSQGQVIGLEGSTGNSTGSHLHFEVIINGTTVDPLLYISR